MSKRSVSGASVTILVADDDEDDRELIAEALEATGWDHEIRFVADGHELLEYLRRQDGYADPAAAPWPTLILLDLNMPRLGGLEVLKQIRADPALQRVPVVVLTTSSDQAEIDAAYERGANSYIVKPMTHRDLVDAMTTITDYWFGRVERPGGG